MFGAGYLALCVSELNLTWTLKGQRAASMIQTFCTCHGYLNIATFKLGHKVLMYV
jgi:hypothetical protein